MSRIGKKPIQIPQGVEVKIEGNKVFIKGPKGELSREIRPEIKVEIIDNQLLVCPLIKGEEVKNKKIKAFWGLTRALLANMVEGVIKEFERRLEIRGVGFKAVLEGENLILSVGYSHTVKIEALPEVKFSVEKNIIIISGIDIEKVSEIAAKIRRVKPPEPYKGKGIRYLGEHVRKKLGKKAGATG